MKEPKILIPFIFSIISVSDASQASLWQTMTTIKHTILKKWDASSHGVKICCIKFAQKVVQVQTQGPIADPRVCDGRNVKRMQEGHFRRANNQIQRPEKNETSLAIVPRNHPLLAIPNIEAETSGLLDRLLNVFHENSRSVASPHRAKGPAFNHETQRSHFGQRNPQFDPSPNTNPAFYLKQDHKCHPQLQSAQTGKFANHPNNESKY